VTYHGALRRKSNTVVTFERRIWKVGMQENLYVDWIVPEHMPGRPYSSRWGQRVYVSENLYLFSTDCRPASKRERQWYEH